MHRPGPHPPPPRAPTGARPALALACVLAAACGGGADDGEVSLVLDPTRPELRGAFDVTGEITLPPGIPAGAYVYLGVSRGRPLDFGESDERVAAVARGELQRARFRLRGFARGRYALFAGVDLDRDTRVGAGEPGGYFDGTTLAPLRDPATARLVDLESVTTPLSFGIGPAPATPRPGP